MASNSLLVAILIITLLSGVFSLITLFSLPATPQKIDVNKLASDVAGKIVVPAAPPVQNLSSIEKDIADLKANQNKDDNWKTAAKDLATSEWSRYSNKAVYNFLDTQYGNIDVRDDISSIVVKNVKVTSFDAESKDATVIQELTVRYEDTSGDKQKVYLEVDTTITDNEVDEQDITVL